jgi:hypothetical protein
VTSADGGVTWTVRTSGTANQLNGVISARRLGGGQRSTILRTTDGGDLGRQTSGTANNLFAVYFLRRLAGPSAQLHVRRTTDGGATWTAQTSGTTRQLNAVYFSSDTAGYAVGATGTVRRTINGGTTWTGVTSGIGTTNAFYAIASVDATRFVLVGAAGTVRRSVNGGVNWTTQLPGTSNDLRALSIKGVEDGWMCGTNGTILELAEQTPPITTIQVVPAAPDGDNGWYVTTPTVTFSRNEPGVTRYSWLSAAGPFSLYAMPIQPAVEGTSTVWYYSTDVAGNSEVVRSSAFGVDTSGPTSPSITGHFTESTTTVSLAWSTR